MSRKLLPLCLALLVGAVLPARADLDLHPFAGGREIRILEEDGRITARSIIFKVTETRVQATVVAYCDEGKDQLVEVDVALLDQAGNIVATLAGKGKIEEEEQAKIKLAAKLSPAQVSAIESFQVALFARAD